ncbi:MAG: hypothetical protein KatS3mg087_0650 [Patescibacteria group bacterium]|nr:MAG: hypothetical protein KatS3mg087_0650 [Patescibacteria group bacterium]
MLINPKPGFWLFRWAIASDPFEAMGIWIDAYEQTEGCETELSTQQEIYLDFWKAPLPFRLFVWCKDWIAVWSLKIHNYFHDAPWEIPRKVTVTSGKFKAVVTGCEVDLYRDRTLLTSWTAETPEDAFQQAILEVRYLAKEIMGDGENF